MQVLKKDHIRVSGDGIFYTIQGEGINAGKPAIFLRLHECNLQCDWSLAGGEICDAWYTWKKDTPEYQKESRDVKIDDLRHHMETYALNTRCKHFVITGGEPMMQQYQILELIRGTPFTYEIETNGTIRPIAELHNVQFNVSPKLSTSGNKIRQIRKYNVLEYFEHFNSWYKFVVACEGDVDEILDHIAYARLSRDRIMLMPEGTSEDKLKENMATCVLLAKQNGWRVTPRLQISMFGNTRAT